MKQQLHTRVDRILHQQFLAACQRERLRPGEALEALMRAGVQARTIVGLASQEKRTDARLAQIYETLFRVKLHAFEHSTKWDVDLHANNQSADIVDDDRLRELLELSAQIDDPKLLEEFEKTLASSLSHKHKSS